MTIPAVTWGAGRKKRRAPTEKQKAKLAADLCDCPSCCAGRPERLALREKRQEENRKLALRLGRKEC